MSIKIIKTDIQTPAYAKRFSKVRNELARLHSQEPKDTARIAELGEELKLLTPLYRTWMATLSREFE